MSVATGRRGQIFILGVLENDEPGEEHALEPCNPRDLESPRQIRWPPLSALATDPKDAVGIARAYLEHRYTQQEVADHLGVHYSTISWRVRGVDERQLQNMMRDCRT